VTTLLNWAGLQSRAATRRLPAGNSSCSCDSPESHQQITGPVASWPTSTSYECNTEEFYREEILCCDPLCCRVLQNFSASSLGTALLVDEEEEGQSMGQLLTALETLDTPAAAKQHWPTSSPLWTMLCSCKGKLCGKKQILPKRPAMNENRLQPRLELATSPSSSGPVPQKAHLVFPLGWTCTATSSPISVFYTAHKGIQLLASAWVNSCPCLKYGDLCLLLQNILHARRL